MTQLAGKARASQSPRSPTASAVVSAKPQGQWGPVLTLPNAAIHSHVLPNGHVLMWGRRDRLDQSLDEHECTPFLWDPTDPTDVAGSTVAKTIDTPQPTLAGGATVNLFCGGHVFLPDGRLLAVGGHITDGDGLDQASIYDFEANTWEPTARMNKGRWYPTATTLPDGSVLVLAGSYKDDKTSNNTLQNLVPQVWSGGNWADLQPKTLDLFPRAHVISDGRVFISGPMKDTLLLDTTGLGMWSGPTTASHETQLDYAPAVMYDVDKILYIGGGQPPTADAKIIDLQQTPLTWQDTGAMHFARRQHNATLLPDGTVLVTGGTQGGGTGDKGFNNLDPGMPLHIAELWDPATSQWTQMAAEGRDRCYHATAVLLPDATVLSAGGGEFKVAGQPNDPNDTHRDGQIFYPPYLFKGDRPQITGAPTAALDYGQTFDVESDQADDVAHVTWIRLSSVTHSFNQNQRINFLQFRTGGAKLAVTTPQAPNVCPPGHYMLFLVNHNGVPSEAAIVQIGLTQHASTTLATAHRASLAEPLADTAQLIMAAETLSGPSVVVGLTSNCPYGLATCWGGAYEALNGLAGVQAVNPVADGDDSTAQVFLAEAGLPPVNRWIEQFRAIVNDRYEWRGVEITLDGDVEERGGSLSLNAGGDQGVIRLLPLNAADKIQFDNAVRARKPLDALEAQAFTKLVEAVKNRARGHSFTVTGPLEQTAAGYQLHVRQFSG